MENQNQGSLNLLEQCPRKFQHVYIDQLGPYLSPEQMEGLTWGNHFHQLMQQRELHLPIDLLAETELSLQQHVVALTEAKPNLFVEETRAERFSEHSRTWYWQGYGLTVIYDLLIAQPQEAHILDWKTYPQIPNTQRLAQNWQTRLYPMVLAATSDYQPEQITMTYWFIPRPGPAEQVSKPQHLDFPYSTQQYEQDQQALSQLLTQLTTYLAAYKEGTPFPQVAPDSPLCPKCPFALGCRRIPITAPATSKLLDLDQIPEVALGD